LISSIFGSKKDTKAQLKESKKQFYKAERNNSCNEVDSDDLDGELNLSDCEDGSNRRVDFKSQRRAKKKREANKYVVEADTNIF
jgi:hypothetical protein